MTIAVTGTGGGATTLSAPVNGADFPTPLDPTAAGTFTPPPQVLPVSSALHR